MTRIRIRGLNVKRLLRGGGGGIDASYFRRIPATRAQRERATKRKETSDQLRRNLRAPARSHITHRRVINPQSQVSGDSSFDKKKIKKMGEEKNGKKEKRRTRGSCRSPGVMKIALRFGQQITKLLKASFESPPCNSLELAPTPSSIDTSRCLSTVIGVAM